MPAFANTFPLAAKPMKRIRLKITIIILVALCSSSCGVNSWDVDKYKSTFESNRVKYNELVAALNKCNFNAGYSIYNNKLPNHITILLEELEITNAFSIHTTCNTNGYQFETKWSTKAHLSFINDVCVVEQSARGYHTKKSNMIELWGLGNGWVMMIDHDFI
jgi:hypothetical protein